MKVGLLLSLVAALVCAAPARSAPGNDDPGNANPVGALPARLTGTTRDASSGSSEPAARCGPLAGTVWYSLRADRRGAIAVRLEAAGKLEAVVGVFRKARTTTHQVACRGTSANGRALLAFYGRRDREYLVVVGARRGSPDDEFTLDVRRPEPRALPPGRAFGGAVRSTVHPLLDADDAWSYPMERGRTYRINMLPARNCIGLYVYRPRAYRFASEQPIAQLECGGYTLFTPGPDGGGRYSLLVVSDPGARVEQPYVLNIGLAESDDVAPGVDLGPSADVTDALSGRGLDLIDLYRFRATVASELDVRLRNQPKSLFSVAVLRPTGERVETEPRTRPGRTVLRRRLDPGHYYLAVRSSARSGGPYSLSLRVRGITATDMLVGGQRFIQVEPGAPQLLAAQVASAGIGGRVRFQFDRRDPFFGWHFSQLLVVPVGPSGLATATWVPPGFGHWRVRARFLGTDTAASSESGYTRIFAAESLGGP